MGEAAGGGWADRPDRHRSRSARPALVAGTPVVLVAVAAIIPLARLPVLAGLVGGLAVQRGDPVGRWTWAAPIGVAVSLAWGLLDAPLGAADGSDCASVLSPPATWRLGEAALVLAALAALVQWLPSGRAELGLAWPSGRVLASAVAGAILVGPVAVLAGPALAAPFFGEMTLRTDGPGAVVPALVFAASNGTMEELAYRGALQGWLAHGFGGGPAGVGDRRGVVLAIVAQAVVFGLAHGIGAEFTGSPLPVVGAMIAGGLLAGFIVRRTGSLALPIAVHVALDVPLYYYWACRVL